MSEAEAPRSLVLIDAMSLVFRAFYAPMQMALVAPNGTPTKAVYIFLRTLRKILRERSPDGVAVVFDLATPTFRDKLLQAYKANRPPFPADLTVQLPYVRRFCEALGVPIVEKEGYEADDVIGTLAREGAEQGMEVLVVSGDEDLFQLVNDRVRVLKPAAGAREGETLCDVTKVKEILGVEPAQVVDWIALTGDPSDNIPGARPLPGMSVDAAATAKKRSYIGPKGATQLIEKFGTLEAALENWQVAGKQSYRDALRDFRKEALLSKELATIHTSVPLEVRVSELTSRPQRMAELTHLCRELGFQSLLKEFVGESHSLFPPQPPAEEFATPEALSRWLNELAPGTMLAVAATVEVGESFSSQLTALGLADASRRAVVRLESGAARRELLETLRPTLEDATRVKATHNSKLLRRALKQELVNPRGAMEDTLLFSFLLDPLSPPDLLSGVMLRWKGSPVADSPAAAAAAIYEIASFLEPEVTAKGLKRAYDEIELPLVAVLAELEEAGIDIDPAILAEMSGEFQTRLTDLTREIYDLAGEAFEVDSPRQLGEILFEKLKLPGGKRLRKSGQYSTEASVLEALAEQYELPRKILQYRTRAKLKSTYVDALPRFINPVTGRLHSTFNQAGSRTGRLSSANPNLQNIPADDEFGQLIRSAFVAAPGHRLIVADYSQIELRVLAHLADDPLLIDAFSRDEDIHSRTAQELFGVPAALQTREHRRMAKAINYGVIYGLSPYGLAQRTGTSQAEAQRYIEEYFRRYRQVDAFLRSCVEQARSTSEVRTLFGRLRPIPEIQSSDAAARNRAEREAMNTPLQGTAADLMKLAMVKAHARLENDKLKTRMILTVHDELIFEAPEFEVERARNVAVDAMEGVFTLRVPLRVEAGVGLNWRDAK
jgi:DNA polymerase I